MSSAGTIFREDVKRIDNSLAGIVEFIVDIENDGFILTFTREKTTADLHIAVYSVTPGDADDILLTDCLLNKDKPQQAARMCGRQIRISATWTGSSTATFTIKSISGAAVLAYRRQLEEDVKPLATREQMNKLIETQKELHNTMETLLSHARYITQINGTNEGKY